LAQRGGGEGIGTAQKNEIKKRGEEGGESKKEPTFRAKVDRGGGKAKNGLRVSSIRNIVHAVRKSPVPENRFGRNKVEMGVLGENGRRRKKGEMQGQAHE